MSAAPKVPVRPAEWHPDIPGPDECRFRLATLTPREDEVLGLVARGWPQKVIARRLGVTPNGLRRHMEAIRRKLDVSSCYQATAIVLRVGEAETLAEVLAAPPVLTVVPDPLVLPSAAECRTMIQGLPAGAQSVMRALAGGCERCELADELGLTAGTVRQYISLAYAAMDLPRSVRDRLGVLAAMWRQAYPDTKEVAA